MENLKKWADLSNAKKELQLVIEDKTFSWAQQYITGIEVKKLVGASDEVQLFLAIKKPWEDEMIEDGDKVDLARPGLEKFFFKKVLFFTLNKVKYKWYDQYITGEQLRKLGGIPAGQIIYLAITEPWDDELIKDEDRVDLARPSIEHFYSTSKEENLVLIKVNNVDYKVKTGPVNVKQIKELSNVPIAHELEQLIDGKLTPLTDDAGVTIKGGEQFFSHVKDGSSS